MSNSFYKILVDTEIPSIPYLLLNGYIKDLDIRILLETDLMRDKNYQYMFLFNSDKMGCDLRELIFNQSDNTTRRLLLKEIDQIKNRNSIPHILTDIDDTIFPNFNGILETLGSDTSWTNKQTYPGLKKFYDLFYKNIKNVNARYSTVLTGTPAFFKGQRINNPIIQNAIGPRFGFIQGFDRKQDALKSLLKGMWEQPFYKMAVSVNDLANIKYEKYRQYRLLFPEYKLLFIGDNGQGDLIAGQKILKNDPTAQVFIHNLLRRDGFIFSEEEINILGSNRLYFFNNYQELGNIFYILGYLNAEDLVALRNQIYKELRENRINDKDDNHYFHYNQTLKLKRN